MRHFPILVFTLLIGPSITAQLSHKQLDSTLAAVFDSLSIPGGAVAVVDRTGTIYHRAFGDADVANRKVYTMRTRQNIGSVSKTFVAVAIMKAVELGYFDLQTDINSILPFHVVNPFHPTDTIKIEHLVTHTSGIIDNDSIYKMSYRFYNLSQADSTAALFLRENGYVGGLSDTALGGFLKSYLSTSGKLYSQLNFSQSRPGRRSAYSNIGSALAAYLIEVRSGVSFQAFTDKYIFKPLHMNKTMWRITNSSHSDRAVPYLSKEHPFPFYSLTTYPDGGLETSVAELVLYVQEMIRSLNGHPKLLTSKSVASMFRPRFSADQLPENFSLAKRNKGVFWNLYNDGFVGHDGDDPGACANVLFNDQYGIIFMANMYIADRTRILDLLKKLHPLPLRSATMLD